MSFETLTYAALGARLNISPEAARSLAKRLRLPRSLSDDGKAMVGVDLAEIRHTPRPPGHRRAGHLARRAATIAALQAEIARLEASVAGHQAEFERERERADRLAVELLQATAETMAAKEMTARLEAEVAERRPGGWPDRRPRTSRAPARTSGGDHRGGGPQGSRIRIFLISSLLEPS